MTVVDDAVNADGGQKKGHHRESTEDGQGEAARTEGFSQALVQGFEIENGLRWVRETHGFANSARELRTVAGLRLHHVISLRERLLPERLVVHSFVGIDGQTVAMDMRHDADDARVGLVAADDDAPANGVFIRPILTGRRRRSQPQAHYPCDRGQ